MQYANDQRHAGGKKTRPGAHYRTTKMNNPTRAEFLQEMGHLFDNRRATANQLLKAARTDDPRTAPIADNVTDVEKRKKLWHKLHDACAATDYFLPVISFAIFLICPLDRLQSAVDRATAEIGSIVPGRFIALPLAVLRSFLAKGGGPSGTPRSTAPNTPTAVVAPAAISSSLSISSPLAETALVADSVPASGPSNPKRKASDNPPSTPPAKKKTGAPLPSPLPAAHTPTSDRRSRSAASAAYQRDGHKCILTGYGLPDAAHIFPFSGNKDTVSRNRMLEFLECYWGPEATAVWRAKCEDANVTESPQNILCLGKHMHALWGSARFGLKPLRDERAVAQNEVWVQFHWLRQGLFKPTDFVSTDAPDQQMDVLAGRNAERCDGFATSGSDSHRDSRGCNGTLAHRESGILIETGQVFVIRAEDPRDLPSLDLLELQWHLVRLAAISGAADVFDENGEYDGTNPGAYVVRDALLAIGYAWGADELGWGDDPQQYQSDIEPLDSEDNDTTNTAS
ncbi:hypothetical protein F503_01351 [Ophiostoma piceae UAMH 11346]|uniref:HNH nuclease domain-containing protein n=1 Tax=Ophiostoma piceae (strain UAMH 11346) TaxID=1262450 RepID=S3BV17_OPHP1|nr:hypothetical protein F503_01351 [Ophiostoma piceae UAMH 11346]